MLNIIKIAFRNLYRQKRRTFLTVSIIAFGVVAVLLFTSLAGTFKSLMVGQITDSMLGHGQIHRKGFVASIENLPVDKLMPENLTNKVIKSIDSIPHITAVTKRILISGMLSNYLETTNLKISGINPDDELKVAPLLGQRVIKGAMPNKGEIILPQMVMNGLKLSIGQDVVFIATNKDGSVNGQTFKISGIIETVTGPSGKYGYMHIDDAAAVLRMEKPEINEIAFRVDNLNNLDKTMSLVYAKIASVKNKDGIAMVEAHSWRELSPFYNIAKMIDMMTTFIQVILIGIVLVSVMNVMVMAVYERIREIGTLSAMGTLPSTIRLMFMTEGLLIGLFGAIAGSIIGSVTVFIIKISGVSVSFAMKDKIMLHPDIPIEQIVLTSGIILVISALAAIEPAIKASKLDPVESLRHN